MATEALIAEASGDSLGCCKAHQGCRQLIEGTERCAPLLKVPVIHTHPWLVRDILPAVAHPTGLGVPAPAEGPWGAEN
jgi:hypothetical protein